MSRAPTEQSPRLRERGAGERGAGERSAGERGVALIATVIVIVVIATAAADFAYNTQVDLSSATNSRDDLRAHYLARSGVNLSRLLLRVQQRIVDPKRKYLGGMDLQVADYAPLLMSAFNSREGAEALGSLLGIESGGIKGLGVDTGSFDLEMESLDGRLNLNCGGGTNSGSSNVVRFAAALASIMLSTRYNRLFEEPDEGGQYADRLEVMRAIIDWADQDTVMFGSSGVEDYQYNQSKDPYEIKNHYYDTVEELRLVKGVDDDFMAAFGDAFTVYGSCKVNINLAEAPLITALIIQHAATPNDPALRWENITMLSLFIVHIRDFLGGYPDMKSFIRAVEAPSDVAMQAFAVGAGEDASEQMKYNLPRVRGVKLKQKTLQEAIVVGGPRRIWRITASAKVGRIEKKIVSVWDMKYVSFQAKRHNMGPGGFLYWREE
jgi:Type II secretion system (T2SS), protein K